ncbi:MAG TPA: translation initiation factor IF-2 N-terminal domain-containing protein, partial [Verrucomicrobiae bacterium]|nr:translation initiation factor IF-2 N-terminal domain-containing protein [Verrucomicrobiae bacterium]
MPVRIYDISKKLGLENKVILAKAKSLGIAAAKVPSSSLDKISAEFLEEELYKEHPEVAAKFAAPPVVEKPKAAPVEEKIVIIKAPPPEPKPEVKVEP